MPINLDTIRVMANLRRLYLPVGILVCLTANAARPAGPERITLTSASYELTLGKDQKTRLTIQVDCPQAGTPMVRANLGKLGAVKKLDKTHYQVEYTPPWQPDPDVALIWASVTDQTCAPGYTAITLLAEKKIRAQVPPNARVSLKIGKSIFGPARADSHGSVEIPAKLSPGFASGRLEIALAGGKTRYRRIKLGVKPRARVGAISVPATVRASGRTTTNIYLFATSASGRPQKRASFQLKTRAGRIKPARPLGAGLYRAVFRPKPSLTGGRAKITVKLKRPGRAKRSLTVRLLPGQRIAIGVESSQPKLSADGESKALITATIANRQDQGLEQLPVEIVASRGRMGPVSDLGGGRYQAELVAPLGGSGNIKIVVSVGSQAGFLVLPLAKPELLTVTADPPRLIADGQSKSAIRIRAFGPEGASGAKELSLQASGGSIPERVPLEGSRAEAIFRAGTRAGSARLEVRLGPAKTHLDIPLDPGPPARIELSASSSRVVTRCNAILPLSVRVVDAHENPVPDAQIEMSASVGKLDPPVPGESGELIVGYRPPLNGSGQATVRVSSVSGLEDRLPIRLVEPPERIGLALALGVSQNLDRLGAVQLTLESSFRMFGSLFMIAGLGYFGHRFDDLSVDVIPIWLGLSYRFESQSRLTPTGQVGMAALGFRAKLASNQNDASGENNESSILPAAFVRAGLDFRLGPGGLFLELGYQYVPWWEGQAFTGRLGGLSTCLGYRLTF